MHVIFIAQETTEKDEEKIHRIVPSLNGKSATEIAYFMDIVGYIYCDKQGTRHIITSTNERYLTKDRSNCIGNSTDPSFGTWVEKVQDMEI